MAVAHDRPSLDLEALKTRQQAMWASGDYGTVASKIVNVAERLCDAADLHAGWRVLDVATGNGNVAIAAARRGCEVVGVDYVPALWSTGVSAPTWRASTSRSLEGDAESLAFPDASFDAVTSVFGVMFAPDQPRAAAELLRVCRPGGTIGLASWTPDRLHRRDVPRRRPRTSRRLRGLPRRSAGGPRTASRSCLAMRSPRSRSRSAPSPSATRARRTSSRFFRTWYGPTLKAFESLDPAGQSALAAALVDLARRHDRAPEGAFAVDATYLEAIAVRS